MKGLLMLVLVGCLAVSLTYGEEKKHQQKAGEHQPAVAAKAAGGNKEAKAHAAPGKKADAGQKKAKGAKKNAQKAKKAKKLAKKLTGRQSSSCLASNCLDLAVAYIGVLRTKVGNYQKQVTRLGKLNSTSGSKNNKQNSFLSTTNHLIAQGGGNKTELKCGSSTNNTGALQLKNLTNYLSNCSVQIAAACNTTVKLNATAAAACDNATNQFSTAVNTCWNMTLNASAAATDICTCWTSSSLATNLAVVKACDLSSQATAQAAQTQACVAAYGTCRKYQDSAVTAIAACNSNPAAVASGLKSVVTNKAKVNKAQAALAALTKKSLAVKDLNQQQQQPLLNIRQQTATYTCADVIFLTNELLGLMDDNPASTLIADVADQLANATAVATCTTSDVASLVALDEKITSTEDNFDEQITEFQDILDDVTGTTASDSDILEAANCLTPSCDASYDYQSALAEAYPTYTLPTYPSYTYPNITYPTYPTYTYPTYNYNYSANYGSYNYSYGSYSYNYSAPANAGPPYYYYYYK